MLDLNKPNKGYEQYSVGHEKHTAITTHRLCVTIWEAPIHTTEIRSPYLVALSNLKVSSLYNGICGFPWLPWRRPVGSAVTC